MKHSDKLYQIAFSQLYGIGPVRARRILKLLTHPRDFFETGFKELQQLTSIPISQLEKTDRASALLRAQGQLPYLENEQLSYHFITDTTYPERLRHCTDAPLGLFFRGQAHCWQKQRCIAVVGTRQQSPYGKKIIESFISELPKDILVISGLAQGVDADVIAGLVDAVVVIESKANGGSLITAELANDYNREVFAFPGPIHHPQSEGCHALIRKQQAHLLSSAKELLEIMNWTNTSQGNKLNQHHDLTALQKEMLDQFKNKNNWSIDELAFSTQKAVSIISSTLFELEMQGSIQNIGANRYRLPL